MLGGRRLEVDERSPAIVGILATLDEPVIFELTRQLAHRGQRQADRLGDLADRLGTRRPDVREHPDVPPAERRVAADELEQLGRGPPPGPQPAHHSPQLAAELTQLFLFSYHRVTIIPSEVNGGDNSMCGSHGQHRRGRHGFPSREQLYERLQGYQQHLESEQKKVQELLERLGDQAPQQV